MDGEPAVAEQPNLFQLASSGDLRAMREIYAEIMDMPGRGVCSVSEATCGAEVIARLVAAGGRPEDRMALAWLLLSRAQDMRGLDRADRAHVYTAEAIFVLDRLADGGDVAAEQILVLLCDSAEVSPKTMELAKNWITWSGGPSATAGKAGALSYDGYLAFRDEFLDLFDPRFYSVEWLDREVWSGRIRCFASTGAAILVTIKTYPTGALELHGMAAAGDMASIVGELIPQAEEWARGLGCIVAVIESHQGWQRVMKSSGYSFYQTGLRKELGDGIVE